MKKRFMIVFMLLFLVLPLAGCPNDAKDMVEVVVELKKVDESSYNIGDCAKTYGAGKYEKGSQVTVGLNVISEACRFDHYEKDGTINDTESTVSFVVNQPTHVTFYVDKLNNEQQKEKASLYFDGVYMTEVSQGTPNTTQLNVNDYKFPKLSDGSLIGVQKVNNEMKKSYSLVGIGMKTLNAILTEEAVNLNYLYLNNNFQPYKLKWVVGTSSDNTCTYSPDSPSIDPNSYNSYSLANGTITCIMATLDTTKIDAESKKQSLNNLLSASAYITTSNDASPNSCFGASSANVNVSSDCMFVTNIKNMINNNIGYAEYYGVTDNNRLEAVLTTTETSNRLKYYICETMNVCSSDNTFKMNYSTNNYGMLKIGEFIKGLFAGDFVNFSSTLQIEQYDYNSKVKDIVPKQIKIDGKTYYINIIDYNKSTQLYTGSLKVNVYAADATRYTFNFSYDESIQDEEEKQKLNTIIEKLNNRLLADNFNLFYTSSGTQEEFNNKVRKTIYKIITQNADNRDYSQLTELRNYIFDVSKTTTAINVKLKSALINRGVYSNTIFIKDKDGNIYQRDQSLTSIVDTLRDYINMYILKDSEKDLSDLEIVNIRSDNEGKILIYEFNAGGNITTIEYNADSKEFKLNEDTTLKLLNQREYYGYRDHINHIIYEIDTVIGVLTQSLNFYSWANVDDSIVTRLNGRDIKELGLDVTVDKNKILKVEHLLRSVYTKLYQIEGEDRNKYFVYNEESHQAYVITKMDISEKYILEYDNEKYELEMRQDLIQLYD